MTPSDPERPIDEQPSEGSAGRARRPLRVAVASALLALLIGAVFYPLLGYEFIDYDTFPQVVRNEHIRGLTLKNVKHILTSRCINSYYPVRTLTFAADYQIWGLKPVGFKLTNILIHFGNALLVMWLVLRLFGGDRAAAAEPGRGREIAVAAFAGGIAAVHPVMVEPVAWIPGREELLMTLGALATVHFHLTARRRSDAGRRWIAVAWHAAAAVACGAACLSNAVGAVVPMLAVALDVLVLRRRPKAIVLGTAPMWAIAIATVLAKRLGPGTVAATAAQFSAGGRMWIGLAVYGLDLKSVFWPAKLALHYDWLQPSGLFDPQVLFGIAALAATAALAWTLRKKPIALAGIAWWCIALAPSLQIFPHHIHRADRFLYLPMMGVALAVAAVLRRPVGRRLGRKGLAAAGLAGVLLLAALAAVSARQVRTWRDSYTAWQQCIDIDPDNVRAINVLGDVNARDGRPAEAFRYYEKAMKMSPDNLENLGDFARELTIADDEHRDSRRAVELASRAFSMTGGRCPERRQVLVGALSARAVDFQNEEEFAQAIETYRKALRLDPRSPLPSLNLALLLATCSEEKYRRPQEAVKLAEDALQYMTPPDVNAYLILATTYASVGRYQAAAMATEEAIAAAERLGDRETIPRLRRNLEFFRSLKSPE